MLYYKLLRQTELRQKYIQLSWNTVGYLYSKNLLFFFYLNQ